MLYILTDRTAYSVTVPLILLLRVVVELAEAGWLLVPGTSNQPASASSTTTLSSASDDKTTTAHDGNHHEQ